MAHPHQTVPTPWSASLLRRDLNARAQHLAITGGLLHEQTSGTESSIIFGRDDDARHGNFHPASYAAICANPDWSRRLKKIHTAHRRVRARSDWQWMELDCANSSDALLMNIFCHPAVHVDGQLIPAVAGLLGVPSAIQLNFGIHPGVPLKKSSSTKKNRASREEQQQDSAFSLFREADIPTKPPHPEELHLLKDRTEVDLQLDALLIEAKLSESSFQTASQHLLERYHDLETVFEVARLPRRHSPTNSGPFQGYQLIRNVLAAFASDASFCVLCDARRRDLIEIWYSVLCAVHYPSFAWRLKLLTWQELASTLPEDLQLFLAVKYGITQF